MASIGMVAYFINFSNEQTNKISFKAAGVKYKEQLTVVSPPDAPIEQKQRPRKYERTVLKKVFVNGTDYFMSLKAKELTNTSSNRVVNYPIAIETTEISSDLQVLSSFDCVKSIPTILLDYMSNMFVNEYGRSHSDFHSQNRIDETLPLLKHFNINCDADQNCSTLFQYDKQYGLNTTADNAYQRNELFYCCPNIHSSTNEKISNVCKHAQKIARKSVFRESKDSTFLEWVTELAITSYWQQLTVECSLSCNFKLSNICKITCTLHDNRGAR